MGEELLYERVAEIVRQVAAQVVLPRYRRLKSHEIARKSGGEIVTEVDRESERFLTEHFVKLLPGSHVVGEEATAAKPDLVKSLGHGEAWLVDPVDGTANFVSGRGPFAIMVTLLRNGTVRASWIFQPVAERLYHAVLGGGAYLNGQRMRNNAGSREGRGLRGAVFERFLPPALKEQIRSRKPAIEKLLPGLYCAGAEYPAVAAGERDFALFWRTLPWDHAPGSLLLREVGGRADHFDGTPYQPDDGEPGLLIATTPERWQKARDTLLAGL